MGYRIVSQSEWFRFPASPRGRMASDVPVPDEVLRIIRAILAEQIRRFRAEQDR